MENILNKIFFECFTHRGTIQMKACTFSHHSKMCVIRAGTMCTVMHSLVLSRVDPARFIQV